MIEFSRLTVLVVGELMLGLFLLSSVLIAMGVIRKNKMRAAAHDLADRIQSDKESRIQRLQERLKEYFLYQGEKLDQAEHQLTQAEMRLYQNIINGFLKQDVVAFQQIDVDVENLVLTYQQLDLPDIGNREVSESITETPDESGELKRLRQENERLSDELRVTMDTMGRMLNEYSSMFAGGAENQLDKQQIIGMFQEEQTSTAQQQPPANQEQEPGSDMFEIDIEEAAEQAESMETAKSADGVTEMVARAVAADAPENAVSDTESEAEMEANPSEDVSEIIDEVFAAADEGLRDVESQPQSEEKSLVDDMANVDIEMPELETTASDESEAAAKSLEEEWAKLLEQDAAASGDQEDTPDVALEKQQTSG